MVNHQKKYYTTENYVKHCDGLNFTTLKLPLATETQSRLNILEWESRS